MVQTKTKKPSIAIRVLKAPLRAVSKMRDFYISSMYSCAAGMGGPAGPYASGLPRSYSTASSRADDDLAELIRISSIRRLNHLDPDLLSQQHTAVVPRSQSVAIGRIDEERSYDFGDDFRLNSLYPRSRSHAVSRMHV
ncbi:hypothetical protein R6Q59_020256 [Mikania micrantha]